jgi:predicted nucleotidyltransferase
MNANNPPAPLVLHQIRDAAERIGRAEDCRLVVLFGSAARGDPHPGDWDLAILGEAPLDEVAVANSFIQMLRVQAVDVCDLRRTDPLLMMLVVRDGIPLYERSAGEFARFASLAARRYADTRKFRQVERREIQDILAGLPQGS